MNWDDVAVACSSGTYSSEPPFHPDERYPEYPFSAVPGPPNPAYAAVREAFRLAGYDKENFGTREWNPLGGLISPGMTVVLKPNWVLSRHHEGGDIWSVITHPSVLRVVSDYVLIALKNRGELRIIDAPQYNCNFAELATASGLDTLGGFLKANTNVRVFIGDLRSYWSPKRHHFSHTKMLRGDPNGFIKVNFGEKSALNEKRSDRFYGAVYHRQETIAAHSGGAHEYSLARSIYNADVVISIPKLKVHKKVGVTLNAKGLVGSTAKKNQLVHYSLGPPSRGGDQYPDGWLTGYARVGIVVERWMYDNLLARRSTALDRLHRLLYRLHDLTLAKIGLFVPPAKRVLDAGNWYGNDSAWRMTVDLYRALIFASKDGGIADFPQRRVFSVIDGIVGGENRGPLVPDARHSGVVIAGANPLAVDLVATRLMGFDWRKVRVCNFLVNDPYFNFRTDPAKIRVVSNNQQYIDCLKNESSKFLDYLPHPGWFGQLEVGLSKIGQLNFDDAVNFSMNLSAIARKEGR